MSGHRRYRRSRSPESSSSGRRPSTSRSSMPVSTTETDDDVHGGGHRRLKRSYASLPVRRSPASHHSWVLLNRHGARRDDFRRDGTTSAMSRTSRGEEISISFELVEPPGTSVLTFDWPPRPSMTPRKTSGDVIAAHRDVVLLATTSYSYDGMCMYSADCVIDLFVYQASRDPARRRRRPSLLLLPSAGGPEIYSQRLGNGDIGIMSSTTSNDVDDSPSFVVAGLQMGWPANGSDVHLFQSRSGQWESFKNLHVHGANGGRDLRWWSTDAVVPYGRRYMIWADYYRGMVIMDLSSETTTIPPPPLPLPLPPRLRYVPLPVDRVGDPEDPEWGTRGCPKASRSVCVTRHGVKFVSVDGQHWSNFGVGNEHVLTWNRRFRITTWSLGGHDDYAWSRDATMHEQEFWDVFDGGDRFPFPHVQPRFPVVDVDNPDVVVFRLEEPCASSDEPKWMIEVDLRKKVLLTATVYSKSKKESGGLSHDADTIESARMKPGFDPIPSELSRYLDVGQGCKKRRQ